MFRSICTSAVDIFSYFFTNWVVQLLFNILCSEYNQLSIFYFWYYFELIYWQKLRASSIIRALKSENSKSNLSQMLFHFIEYFIRLVEVILFYFQMSLFFCLFSHFIFIIILSIFWSLEYWNKYEIFLFYRDEKRTYVICSSEYNFFSFQRYDAFLSMEHLPLLSIYQNCFYTMWFVNKKDK